MRLRFSQCWLDASRVSSWVGVLRNAGWLIADKFVRILFGLIVGLWVARYLGPKSFGELSYLVALVAMLQPVAQLGLDNVVVRWIAREPAVAGEVLGTVFLLRFVSGFFCYASAVLLVLLLRPGDRQALALLLVIGGGLAFQAADVVDLWFQSELQSKRTVLAKLLAYAVSGLLRLSFVLMELPLLAFALAVLVESALSALALFLSYRRYPSRQAWHWRSSRCTALLIEGWPFLLAGTLLAIYGYVDRVLLEFLVGVDEVGKYVAALNLSGVMNFFPLVFCASMAPKMAGLSNEAELRFFFERIYSFLLWISFAFVLLVFLFSDFLVTALYGATYRDSGLVLKVHVFSVIFIFVSVANDYYSLSTRRGSVTLVRTAVGLLVNVGLNVLFIPVFGIMGAAASSVIAHIFSNTLVFWFLMRGSLVMHARAVVFPIRVIISMFDRVEGV